MSPTNDSSNMPTGVINDDIDLCIKNSALVDIALYPRTNLGFPFFFSRSNGTNLADSSS